MYSDNNSEADEVDGDTWQRWESFLKPFSSQFSNGSRSSPTEVVFKLHDLALELRDKLKFTLSRLAIAKSDLTDVEAQLYTERKNHHNQVRAYESEIQQLRAKVLSQENVLSHFSGELVLSREDNSNLKNKLSNVEHERNKALNKLEQMVRTAAAATDEAVNQQTKNKEIFMQLVATKEELASLSASETLYNAAKEELQRLDKENLELKDIITSGKVQMGRSRILKAVGLPDTFDRVAGQGMSSQREGRSPSQGRSVSASRSQGPSSRGGPERGGSLVDNVSNMAFLGPPSTAYPPDPENYQFYRVGGGYSPQFDLQQATIPQPRASGWVPKDVVRLVQAFRHSYSIGLEWPYWEPLVLMIDEVYRHRESYTLAFMKQAQREKIRNIKRQLRSAMSYPSVLANDKISHLRQQLASSQRALEKNNQLEDNILKRMASKDYQLGHQLDRAVEENFDLRKNLNELQLAYGRGISNLRENLLSGDSSDISYSD